MNPSLWRGRRDQWANSIIDPHCFEVMSLPARDPHLSDPRCHTSPSVPLLPRLVNGCHETPALFAESVAVYVELAANFTD